jgi:pseudouridylate synthase
VTVADFEVRYGDEVARARRDGRPVVALETTIVSHGLPRPDNLRVAREIEQAVRDNGAVPATIGMVGGQLVVGVDDDELTRLATAPDVAKLSVRDLAVAAARGVDGATTVAGTGAVAAAAGIRVFATGGLGGVHRGAPYDESADLVALARTPIAVVCAGSASSGTAPTGSPASSSATAGTRWTGRRTRRSRWPTCCARSGSRVCTGPR